LQPAPHSDKDYTPGPEEGTRKEAKIRGKGRKGKVRRRNGKFLALLSWNPGSALVTPY
jgi:hypothetical protein